MQKTKGDLDHADKSAAKIIGALKRLVTAKIISYRRSGFEIFQQFISKNL